MHPAIASYQTIFQKYDPRTDASIDASDIDTSIEVFVTEAARHNNLALLKDIVEKSREITAVKNYVGQWLRGVTVAAILDKNTDVLLYLLETDVKSHDRSAGCLQLLRSLSLKEDLTDFDRMFDQIANHSWKLFPTATLGSSDFFLNLIARNEIARVKHVCQRYPLFVEDHHILNQTGVYACCHNSVDTLKYLLQQPYNVYNWTLWLVGSADAFTISPQTTCADMLLNSIPDNEKVNFYAELVERLQRVDKHEYLPFVAGVVIPHVLSLPLKQQKLLLNEMRYKTAGDFTAEISESVRGNLLKEKISKNLIVSQKSRTKKM